jgi:hypothetical protein
MPQAHANPAVCSSAGPSIRHAKVATYCVCESHESSHTRATHAEIARRLSALMNVDFAGAYDANCGDSRATYLVPSDTLIGLEAAGALCIQSETDLFGGVVPHAFVATKAITHPLITTDSVAPRGWSHAFAEQVRRAVHVGYSAFSMDDAYRAGLCLLERGPLRIKSVTARAGRGQTVISDARTLKVALTGFNEPELSCHGVVVEENLSDVTTCSVGQIRAAGFTASYYGTQRLTADNEGNTVYGGSTLLVVLGDWDALERSHIPKRAKLAVSQARTYDGAAMMSFPGLFASRRNYDVAQGRDAAGRWRSGVLEQSWRVGGASGAEIAALEAFHANPELRSVRASTCEVYGGAEVPSHATMYFHGLDEQVGFLTKYALIDSHVDPR